MTKMKRVKCIDCIEGGSCKEKFICYELKSDWWFKDVLNVTTECTHFKPVVDVGDRYLFTYSLIDKNYEKIKTILNDTIIILTD